MSEYNDSENARIKLIESADMLRRVLYNLNYYGAVIGHDSILATQRDGSAYGEIYDGFKILVGVLYPDHGIEHRATQIIDTMFDGDIDNTTIEVAAQEVMDKNAPLSWYSTDELREDLARYQAYQRALNDGMLDIAKLIGGTSDRARDETQAALYLDERIAECRAALVYRGEPETLIPDYVRHLVAPEEHRCLDPIVLYEDDVDEIRIPARYEICGRCRGNGRHDAWEGGMSSEEMYEQGEEFVDAYRAGHYSVPCTECKGKRVVAVPDELLATPEQLKAWQDYERAEADYRAEAAAERRAGC